MLLDLTRAPEILEDARWPYAVTLMVSRAPSKAVIASARFNPGRATLPERKGLRQLLLLPFNHFATSREPLRIEVPHTVASSGGGEDFKGRLTLQAYVMGDESWTVLATCRVRMPTLGMAPASSGLPPEYWKTLHHSVTRVPPQDVTAWSPEGPKAARDLWSLLKERR